MWQKAHALVLEVYKITSHFPKEETYGLSSQFRRSSVSVTANIAEGFKKKSNLDKLRFYNIAQGSLEETTYYVILSKDLNYLSNEEWSKIDGLSKEVSRLLNSFYKSISK